MSDRQIKICGISTSETLDAVLQSRADYVGFVFFAKSPRHLAFDQAALLADQCGSRIERVGVFVDPDDELLGNAIASGKLDALQLHKVTAQRRAEIRVRFGLPIWSVLEIAQRRDTAALGHYEVFDRLIYDAKTPAWAKLPGGMGLAFDWTLLTGIHHPPLWGLAGGLNCENVGQAISVTQAPLVDTSSGVESAPGIKDADKIAAFCAAVRLA